METILRLSYGQVSRRAVVCLHDSVAILGAQSGGGVRCAQQESFCDFTHPFDYYFLMKSVCWGGEWGHTTSPGPEPTILLAILISPHWLCAMRLALGQFNITLADSRLQRCFYYEARLLKPLRHGDSLLLGRGTLPTLTFWEWAVGSQPALPKVSYPAELDAAPLGSLDGLRMWLRG